MVASASVPAVAIPGTRVGSPVYIPHLPKFQSGNLGGGRTPQEQEMVKCESESMDRQIDTLVYALYGLTEEEIRIVER